MDFLCFPGWLTLQAEETEHDYTIEALPLSHPESCPGCGALPESLQRFGRQRHFVRDAPVRGKRVRIYFNAQRYRCLKCNKFSQQPLSGLDERRAATERFIRYVEREALKRPFITVADEVGVSPGTVRAIFADFAERCTNTIRFETPRIMGLDEVYVGRVARCILTDISERRIIEILPKRDMVTVARHLIQMPGKDRIEAIAMDMWRPFYTVIHKVLPGVEIVIDTYHVQRMANQIIMTVLRKIRGNMTIKDQRECLFDRFILLKRGYNLSQTQRDTLRQWGEKVPEVRIAYELKEEFLEIWSLSGRNEAERRYRRWKQKIPSSLESAFSTITGAVKNWGREIFNYFDHKITNAFTESANNIIKSVQREGRAYSYEIVRAKMLYGGAFVTRRPPHPLDKADKAIPHKNAVKPKRRSKRAPSPSDSSNSKVARLRRAREEQDQILKSVRGNEGWRARFKHHLKDPDESR